MSTYLWPTILDDPYEISSDAEILESFFDQIFSPYKTIYLSQARHFIPLILRYYNLGRSDIIFTPPYSSHCLLSNIALQATPTVQNELNNEINASIIYHQYGKTEKVNNEIYPNIIIEDSVDSFIINCSKENIFPNNANFAIISLSKILPLPFGGIMICKDQEHYNGIKNNIFNNDLDITSYELYQKNKYLRPAILRHFQKMTPAIKDIEYLYESTRKKIESNCRIVEKKLNIPIDKKNILPSNILSKDFDILNTKEYKNMNIQQPIRHIYNYDQQISEKRVLIPVHAQANW
jgi:putative PLP-dependent aminotransferase (TIGR04422 family)